MATLLQLFALTSVFIPTIVATCSLLPSRTRLEDHHRIGSSILSELGFKELTAAAATAGRIPTTIFALLDSLIV
ncbi:hypothetical protein Acr_00g0056200 [Actinidia rufa]|uniref:Uncharacterized protein n=1 Tax=Actinidia rufa TaxID=165716 RepID=A0A7J0DMA9_9ERIC|nr:hypothetical protein Acr_00g0056200 [Actinidia rufa]